VTQKEREEVDGLCLTLAACKLELSQCQQVMSNAGQDIQNLQQEVSNLTLERTALFQALWDCQKERKLYKDRLEQLQPVGFVFCPAPVPAQDQLEAPAK
jgi:chromosome segregation ATPase